MKTADVKFSKSARRQRKLTPSELKPSAASAKLTHEQEFYNGYDWALNVFPTIGEACDFLLQEQARFGETKIDWQRRERVLNIYFLACGILNRVDELLRGSVLKLPSALASLPGIKLAARAINLTAKLNSKRGMIGIRRWRNKWLAAVHRFAPLVVAGGSPNETMFTSIVAGLTSLAKDIKQKPIAQRRLGIASPFTRLDLMPEDVISLAELIAKRCPDRSQPIVLVGLRTSGSYFCPLILAVLLSKGYQDTTTATMEPSKGLDRAERRKLASCAATHLAIIIDDPPHSGGAIFSAFDILQKVGFDLKNIKAAVPTHPTKRNWHFHLPPDHFISLLPEFWHKQKIIKSGTVTTRVQDYYRQQGFSGTKRVKSRAADQINADFPVNFADGRSDKLKRVFEFALKAASGKTERRMVLVKSVGSGWLGYGAFLSGHRLAGLVPRLLGLRDGLLFMEWVPHFNRKSAVHVSREKMIDAIATYCAARSKLLRLNPETTMGMNLERQNNGTRLVEKALSRAYGAPFASTFIRNALGKRLRALANDKPNLIDGSMVSADWIANGTEFLKVDYEHHGLSKAAPNVTDTGFDLASAILNFSLSKPEEQLLVERYTELSQDHTIAHRLFTCKLMAGLWSLNQAQQNMLGHSNSLAQRESHRKFLAAWNFLTIECARHAGAPVREAAVRQWTAPLVFLDIDGVIDRRIFGFPTTSAAGVIALRHLHLSGFSVALNTARSVSEVKDYCSAYGLAGGSAEYGAYIWDAVGDRGRVVINNAAQKQLEKLRRRLRVEPGVFLDERHEYSIRVFTYRQKSGGIFESLSKRSEVGDGVVGPISSFVIADIINQLKLDLLSYHHTAIDTTVIAKAVNKGTGLVALRDWVLNSDANTIAVGDQKPDLQMFRAATYCYAPANIDCSKEARILGCKIVKQANQNGLHEIAKNIVVRFQHQKVRDVVSQLAAKPVPNDLFLELLEIADKSARRNILSALCGRSAFSLFFR